MGLRAVSGRVEKEKGIPGRETKYTKMQKRESMLLLENYDSTWLEVSTRQDVGGDDTGKSTRTHICKHIQSFWTRAIKATWG